MTAVASPESDDAARQPAPIDGDAPAESSEYPAIEEPKSGAWRLLSIVAVILALGFWQNWLLVVVIASIILMIFMHELGHYLTGKWAGMKVTHFFLGFGPTLWSVRRGETLYGIKAIPAGAFVKVPGMMRDEPVRPEDEGRTYRQAPYYKRVIFASAGSAMHFIMALLLFWAHAVFVGDTDPRQHYVEHVYAGSSADVAGVQAGDHIVSIDGEPTEYGADISAAVRPRAGQTVDVVVDRDGERVTLPTTLGSRVTIIGTVGEDVDVFFTPEGAVLALRENGQAVDAGLAGEDRVVSLDGVDITDEASLIEAVDKSTDGRLDFVVDRGGNDIEATLDLGTDVDVMKPVGQIGITSQERSTTESAFGGVSAALRYFGQSAVLSVEGLAKALNPTALFDLVTRAFTTAPVRHDPVTKPTPAVDTQTQIINENANRPVSLVGSVGMATALAENDWGQLLSFLALLNLFIGIFNLIPLLPFDGGHIAVATYEKIREMFANDGRRYLVNPARVYPMAVAVVAVLGLLFISSVYLDVVDPIRLG